MGGDFRDRDHEIQGFLPSQVAIRLGEVSGDDLAWVELTFDLAKQVATHDGFAEEVVGPQLGEPELFGRLFGATDDDDGNGMRRRVFADLSGGLESI